MSIPEIGITEETLRAHRLEHLDALVAAGNNPFETSTWLVQATFSHVAMKYAHLASEEHSNNALSLAGRVMSRRGHGKTMFLDLEDRDGRLQIYVRQDVLGEERFALWQHIERGDIVGIVGTPFRSKAGELTLRVTDFSVLTKTLAPFPEQAVGINDLEILQRQRYIDLAINPATRARFALRSRLITEIRRIMDEFGFLEVETPILSHLAGGACARPFMTHVNAIDQDMQLRIATELNLKRLIVGGMEAVYEIGRIFRNEGIDHTHNPEFTMMEAYKAYANVEDMILLTEKIFLALVKIAQPDATTIDAGGVVSALPAEHEHFRRMEYFDAMLECGNLSRDVLLDYDKIPGILADLGLPQSPTHAHALDAIFGAVVEPHLSAPTFVTGYPTLISPLAKRRVADPELVDRFEFFVGNMEIANAFSELNDPREQRARFEDQIQERLKGDTDVPEPDWDYVRALEYGMPPTAGIGIGIDRLVMLLTGSTSIRDILYFPLLRRTTI